MPLIACNHCHGRFKVKLGTIGQTVKCPKCRRPFKAVALHSAPRRSHGTPPIVYAAIAAAAALIALLIVTLARDDEEPAVAVEKSGSVPAEAETRPPVTAGSDADPKPRGMQAQVEDRVRSFLGALGEDQSPMLPLWIDYPRHHEEARRRGLVETVWTDLDEVERYARQEEILRSLSGSPETRAFLRHAIVADVSATRVAEGQGKAEVHARLRNPVTEETREADLLLSAAAGSWKVYWIDWIAPPEADAKEVAEDASTSPPESHRRNPEGEVVEVPPVEGTSPSLASRIQTLIATLTDPEATTAASRARRDLVEVGKPAIPYLLNALVPLDLGDQEDVLKAVKISQTLMEMTGETYPIVPGINEGSVVGEGASENERHRRCWFGWWRDNKEHYTGPPVPEIEDF